VNFVCIIDAVLHLQHFLLTFEAVLLVDEYGLGVIQ